MTAYLFGETADVGVRLSVRLTQLRAQILANVTECNVPGSWRMQVVRN